MLTLVATLLLVLYGLEYLGLSAPIRCEKGSFAKLR